MKEVRYITRDYKIVLPTSLDFVGKLKAFEKGLSGRANIVKITVLQQTIRLIEGIETEKILYRIECTEGDMSVIEAVIENKLLD